MYAHLILKKNKNVKVYKLIKVKYSRQVHNLWNYQIDFENTVAEQCLIQFVDLSFSNIIPVQSLTEEPKLYELTIW